MSHNGSGETRDSDGIDKAIAVAAEFRAVMRFAIDAMPQQFPPASIEAILSVVLQNLTSVVHGSFEGALILCREGWGAEADVLLRQILEAAVNARAVTNNRTVLYLYVEEIEKQAVLQAGGDPREVDSPLRPTDILGLPASDDPLAWHQRGKREGKRRHWKDLSMQERVGQSGLTTDTWYGVYRRLCPGVHAAPAALGQYLTKASPTDAVRFAVWFGPNRQMAFRAVGTACALLLVHLGTIGRRFGIKLHQEIRELGARLRIFYPVDVGPSES